MRDDYFFILQNTRVEDGHGNLVIRYVMKITVGHDVFVSDLTSLLVSSMLIRS